jgi:GTP cyclohydrolase I
MDMSYTVSQIYEWLNQWAPFNTAEEWDNVGLNIGEMSNKVESVLIALDVDAATVNLLEKTHYDLVITHHPLIFKPLKNVGFNDDMGRILTLFLKEKINLICAHTNLDKASEGVNDCLIDVFGFSHYKTKPLGVDIGVYFKNKDKLSIDDLRKLHEFRIAGSKSKTIPEKIGFCGGSGHGLIQTLLRKKVDCFITGETNYHDEVFCDLNDITLLLMGHRESEIFVLPKIKEKLNDKFPSLKIDVCS